MDSIDSKILDQLKDNSRMATSEISKRVNLSIPAVAERIRKMEEAGIIEKYTVRINREKTNYKLLAFIMIGLTGTDRVEEFRQEVILLDSVLEVHHIAGEYDYLIKVLVEDTKALEDFISGKLKKIKGIQKSNTIIALSSLKENINL